MEVEIVQRRSNSVKIHGVATVNGETVAEAQMLSLMVPREP